MVANFGELVTILVVIWSPDMCACVFVSLSVCECVCVCACVCGFVSGSIDGCVSEGESTSCPWGREQTKEWTIKLTPEIITTLVELCLDVSADVHCAVLL